MTWITATLGQLADEFGGVIQTGPFGAQLHQSDYRESGTPAIMPQNIVNDRITTDSIARVDETMVGKLSRHVLSIGDIIYPRRGDLNKRALIGEQEAGWLCGTGCLKISLPHSLIAPGYLFYYLKHPQVVQDIENNAVGATMLNLSAAILKQIKIQYPDLKTQERIADILSNYDRLIDNNTRRITLLEQFIHRLYKEWFVYLRFPGCDRVRIVDGVPEGWKRVRLSEIASVNKQNISARNAPDKIQYIDISSVTTGRICAVQLMKLIDAPSRAKRVVAHGDVIWSMVRPGKRAYALVLNPPENLIVSTGFAVLSAEKVPYSFLYQAVTTDSFVDHMENVATGAAYPAVKPKDFEATTLLAPNEGLLNKFDEFAISINQQIYNLHRQNEELREARDLLLPRLMNGSIAV